jgi:hypothetical protein
VIRRIGLSHMTGQKIWPISMKTLVLPGTSMGFSHRPELASLACTCPECHGIEGADAGRRPSTWPAMRGPRQILKSTFHSR